MILQLIHHSHTDIGYTEPQGRITRWHVDFIRQALAAIKSDPTFKWQCECFWQVEQFLADADRTEKEEFFKAVRSGNIGLSGSYLNFSELLNEENLRAVIQRASRLEVPVRSAMTADINGYSWGFAQALLDGGIQNLFTCIHTHHGMYPLGRQQAGFWWETPAGEKLMVWSGEHYHIGNELGLSPGAGASYLTKDECDAEAVFNDGWKLAETRIPRYLDKLKSEEYPFDVVPVMISGLRTDNGPPNPGIAEMVERWNREHEDVCRVEMATLDDFFTKLRDHADLLPTYRGDWPDWWTDGTASYPNGTRLFRQAQRDLARYRKLAAHCPDVKAADPQGAREVKALQHLAMYAEHTFSHQDSVSRPGHFLARTIAGVKQARAARAADETAVLLDGAASVLGGADLRAGTPPRFKVINPWPHRMSVLVRLTIGHHEFYELGLNTGVNVRDEKTGEILPWWRDSVPRGEDYCVRLVLDPGQERILNLEPGREPATWPPDEPVKSSEDFVNPEGDPLRLETDQVLIEWDDRLGITTWLDKKSGVDLLRPDRIHAPFVLVHEISPVATDDQMCAVRGAMGLNRKSEDVVRSTSTLGQPKQLAGGPHFRGVSFGLKAPGISHGELVIQAHADEPRVEVLIRFLKETNWEPENVYAALPFHAGENSQVWLDKTGGLMRPRVDQLPGTLTDYYSVQSGLMWRAGDRATMVATPDSNLIQVGPLDHGERMLMGDPRLKDDPAHTYAWLMTNYWETNFGAELGGFHEFRFIVEHGQVTGGTTELGHLDHDPVVVRLLHE